MNNQFVPFKLTRNTIESFENLKRDQREKGLSFKNPFDDRLIPIIQFTNNKVLEIISSLITCMWIILLSVLVRIFVPAV